MTEQQERFAIEYATSGNATQSAKNAGYSEATAYSQGQRLLKNVEVAEKNKTILPLTLLYKVPIVSDKSG